MNYGYPQIQSDFWIYIINIFGYQKIIEYWIAMIRFLDIQKCILRYPLINFWISKNELWISKNRFMDILKYIFGYFVIN